MFSKPEVVLGCQQQQPQAQAALYNHYKGRLMGLCQRYGRTTAEAEDIFQDAFVKIFNQIHTLKSPDVLDSWVRAIVVRTAIDHYRSIRYDMNLLPIEDHTYVQDELDMLSQLSLDEIIGLIRKLPDGCRLIINLYLIDGYEHAEIAAMTGISVGTSKSQLARGKHLLRNLLHEKGIFRNGQ